MKKTSRANGEASLVLRNVLASLAVAALSLSLCACNLPFVGYFKCPLIDGATVSEANATKQSDLKSSVSSDALLESGTLTIGLKAASKVPYLIEYEDGSYSGLDVDVALALADSLGLKAKFVNVYNASQAGTSCDVVMEVKPGEATSVTSVGDYVEQAVGLFCKGEPTALDAASLAGKKVALQEGSTSEQTYKKSGLSMTCVSYDTLNDSFAALEDGEVEYVMCDLCCGEYLSRAYDDICLVGTVDDPTTLGVGVPSSNTVLAKAVNEALDEIGSNGVEEIARRAWLGAYDHVGATDKISGIVTATATANLSSDMGSNAASA